MSDIKERIGKSVKSALPIALKTSIWFLKIMLPVSFVVMLLSYFDILPYLSSFAAPLFVKIGLPGDAALVFVTSVCTNIYTVIALMANLDFSIREGIILAVMCLISHNFIIETMVLKKTGSSAVGMVLLRVGCSFIAAIGLNWVLPDIAGRIVYETSAVMDFSGTLAHWLETNLILAIKVICIISILMIGQRLLAEFGVLDLLSALFRPLMAILGLPRSITFVWLVGNTLGLAYGSVVILDYAENGKLTRQEADLLNHHLAVSHSQLEDPLLFTVLGLPLLWLIIPRFLLAIIVVWIRRAVGIESSRWREQEIRGKAIREKRG